MDDVETQTTDEQQGPPTKKPGRTQVLAKGKQFLFFMPRCLSYIFVDRYDKSCVHDKGKRITMHSLRANIMIK